MRGRRRGAALAFLGCLALAGCGDDDGAADSGGQGEAATELTITLDPDGRGGAAALEAAVSCPGDDAPVCDAVGALPADPAAAVPPQTACTEIYGGPEIADVQGTFRGKPVNTRFLRTDGCEIARWNRVRFLFPDT